MKKYTKHYNDMSKEELKEFSKDFFDTYERMPYSEELPGYEYATEATKKFMRPYEHELHKTKI